MRTFILAIFTTALTLGASLTTVHSLPNSATILPSKFRDDTDGVHEYHARHNGEKRPPFADFQTSKGVKGIDGADERPMDTVRRMIKNADYGAGDEPVPTTSRMATGAAVIPPATTASTST